MTHFPIHSIWKVNEEKAIQWSSMTAIIKSFCLMFIISLITKGKFILKAKMFCCMLSKFSPVQFSWKALLFGSAGLCQFYSLDSITVSQSLTGALIHDKPEWNTTITNRTPCSYQNLTLACNGFQTVEEVDPSIMAKMGDECLINNGQPVYPFTSLNFTYAWDTSFPFKLVYSQMACSWGDLEKKKKKSLLLILKLFLLC